MNVTACRPMQRTRSCSPRRASVPGSTSTQCSLAFTTYQAGRLFFLGTRADGTHCGRMSAIFEQSQGLWTDTQSVMLLSTRDQLWHFRNMLAARTPRTQPTGADRLFSPARQLCHGRARHSRHRGRPGRRARVRQHRLFLPRHGVAAERAFSPCGSPASSPSSRPKTGAI